jgi:hypothetical protein
VARARGAIGPVILQVRLPRLDLARSRRRAATASMEAITRASTCRPAILAAKWRDYGELLPFERRPT